jgi:hypothetical protein
MGLSLDHLQTIRRADRTWLEATIESLEQTSSGSD